MKSAALVVSLLAAGIGVARAAEAPRILVMPFDNVKGDGRIFWLGEASSVVLTDDLAELGANPITRLERHQAFERLQVPPAAALTDATVIRIGQLLGADRVVVGAIQLDNDVLVIRARSITLEAGRVQVDVTERGPLQDLYATLDRVARKIEPNAAVTSDQLAQRHVPIAAFESYVKGLLAETPATAVNYLTAALKLQPSFNRARLALWDVYSDQDDHEQALAAVSAIGADSHEATRAKFLTGLSQIDLRRFDDAFATFKALADRMPDAALFNNLGVVQLRRGSTPQTGEPAYFFNKAAELQPDDPDYLFNLGYADWSAHDTQAAVYWLREAVRRRPTDGVAHYTLGVALAAAGNSAEAARERELARRLSSEFTEWEKRPAADPVPKGLERIKHDMGAARGRQIESRLASTGQRDQAELIRFYLESGRRLYERESDREAAAELGRALYLSPYLAEAHLLLGRIHLRNGRVKDAIDAFKISLWSTETAEGHAVLGEAYRQDRDLAAARAEAERALALDPGLAEARTLLARLDGR